MKVITKPALIYACLERLGLADAVPGHLRKHLQLQSFQRGEYIAHAAQDPAGVSVIVSGRVQVMPLSESGDEIILNYLYPSDMIGDIEIVMKGPYIHSVTATVATTLLFFPHAALDELMDGSTAFLRYMLHALNEKVLMVSFYSSSTRLYGKKYCFCRYLYEQQQRLKTPLIPLNMKQAAIYIGVSERHLRRIIGELEQECLIEKQAKAVRIVDSPALQACVIKR